MRLSATVALAIAACFATPLVGQEARARGLTERLATTPTGSEGWHILMCELALAEVDVDLRRAAATADTMWHAAQHDGAPGAGATAAMLLAYLKTRAEGITAAAEWQQRSNDLPEPTAPALACYRQLFHARQHCSAGNHANELKAASLARTLANECDDDVLRVRAVMGTLHGTPERGLAPLHDAIAAAGSRGRSGDIEFLKPTLEFVDLEVMGERQSRDAIVHALDQIATAATATGNRRLGAGVVSLRAALAFRAGDPGKASTIYGEACELYRQLGDRIDLARALDLRAWLAIRAENLDEAERLTTECDELLVGRGLIEAERNLLQTRFELAVRMRDPQLADQLSRKLDAITADRQADQNQLEEARDNLRKAEAAREAMSRQLEEEQLAATARKHRRQWQAGAAALVALAAIAGIAWLGRRRLLRANARLSEQMGALEQARSAQAELEGRMQQMARTESLGTLAAGIAHDFNNLLTGIIGNAELLERGLPDADRRELARSIAASGQHGARLCRQLQSYADGKPPTPDRLDLNALLEAMLPMLQECAGSATKVRTTVDSTASMAQVDRAQFEQILLNLVRNSRDAGAANVRIRIAPAQGPQPGAVVEVADDGAGMTQDIALRIFDPFFTTKFPGRGLGLAVVHSSVLRNHGTIVVRSAPGEGTTFTMQLPGEFPTGAIEIDDPLAQGARTIVAATEPKHYEGVTALVVDDEPAVRRVLNLLLAEAAITVHEAASGEEALVVAQTLPADQPVVAFVDLTMPGMDGTEVVARLRELPLDARVIMMSGHSARELDRSAEDARVFGRLNKPFHFEDVRRLLDTLVGEPDLSARRQR